MNLLVIEVIEVEVEVQPSSRYYRVDDPKPVETPYVKPQKKAEYNDEETWKLLMYVVFGSLLFDIFALILVSTNDFQKYDNPEYHCGFLQYICYTYTILVPALSVFTFFITIVKPKTKECFFWFRRSIHIIALVVLYVFWLLFPIFIILDSCSYLNVTLYWYEGMLPGMTAFAILLDKYMTSVDDD